MNNQANKTSFKKGHTSSRTPESYKLAGVKISASKRGKKRGSPSKEWRDKISNSLKGRQITWGDKISTAKAFEGNSRQPVAIRYRNKLEKKAGRPRPDNCEICSRGGKICFDHDHKTGKFRGWICFNCNTVLGRVLDDIGILGALIEYVKRHSS